MKIEDYTKWVIDEIKESKVYTILNLIGILISVSICIMFLSLAFGIEETTINKLTKDMNLFTLKVTNGKKQIYYQDLNSVYNKKIDKIIYDIRPVLEKYAILSYNSIENYKLKKNNILPIYLESYKIKKNNSIELDIINGHLFNNQNENSIIVSDITFKKITSIYKEINRKNFNKKKFKIIITKRDIQEEIPCNIIGIAKTTPHHGTTAYITKKLSFYINDIPRNINPNEICYTRFDFITENLKDLEIVREAFNKKGYDTVSVLDKIDNVRKVLFVINVLFWLIFSIAVIIAIFNIIITLTSFVLKKRKEIGILKSLGATDFQIQNIFILYSVYISSIGSILGVVISYIFINIIRILLSNFDNLSDIDLFKFDLLSVIFVVLLTILVSIVASLPTAKKAASISPIETMRED